MNKMADILKLLSLLDSEPKPKDNLPRECIGCNNLTTLYFSEYPKKNNIIYQCKECEEKKKKERKITIEDENKLGKLFS